MLLANNVIYSKQQNAMHFANGFAGITIAGNVVLGEGVKHSSHLGRGLVDFKELAWDATKHDATPSDDAPFDRGVEAYRPLVDLTGNPRKQTSVTSGAITR